MSVWTRWLRSVSRRSLSRRLFTESHQHADAWLVLCATASALFVSPFIFYISVSIPFLSVTPYAFLSVTPYACFPPTCTWSSINGDPNQLPVSLLFLQFSAGAVAQSVERTTPGEEILSWIPAVATLSLLVRSVSV